MKWILTALMAASVARAQTYVYDMSLSQNDKVANVDGEVALLYFAEKLGVLASFPLDSASSIEMLDDIFSAGDIGAGAGKPKLVIETAGSLPEVTFQTPAQVDPLLEQLKHEVAASRGFSVNKLSDKLTLVSADNEQTAHFVKEFEVYGKEVATEDNQVAFDVAVEDKNFFDELVQLVIFESRVPEADDVVFFQLSPVQGSDEKVVRGLLERLAQVFDVVVVSNEVPEKRDVSRDKAVFNKATGCFTNEESCQVSTSNCNSHGVCTKVKAKCWQCLCSASFDKEKSKTTKWSGLDCGKKDVSSEAHLLLWTTLSLLVAFAGGIKLLVSVGSESLPGVLDAATTKK